MPGTRLPQCEDEYKLRHSVTPRKTEGRPINQAFTWNDLGQLASFGYPNDTGLADAVEPPRTISYTYTNAALTAVPSYLSSISYHSNGMVNTVTHANGTRVVHGKDATARGLGGWREAGCRAAAWSRGGRVEAV